MDALCLNPASISLRRAWLTSPLSRTSFTSCTTCCTANLLLSHGPLTLYIRLCFSALDTAWSVRRVPHLYKDDFSCTYISNLNLLCSPWTSPSHCTTPKCTLSSKPLCIILRNQLLLRPLWKSPAPVSFEEALQSPLRHLALRRRPSRNPLVNHCLKSLRLPLPESSVTEPSLTLPLPPAASAIAVIPFVLFNRPSRRIYSPSFTNLNSPLT